MPLVNLKMHTFLVMKDLYADFTSFETAEDFSEMRTQVILQFSLFWILPLVQCQKQQHYLLGFLLVHDFQTRFHHPMDIYLGRLEVDLLAQQAKPALKHSKCIFNDHLTMCTILRKALWDTVCKGLYKRALRNNHHLQ